MMKNAIHRILPWSWISAFAGMTVMGGFFGAGPARAEAAPTVAPQTGMPLPGPGGGNATAMSDIHDIKPILALDSGWEWLYWLLGALALIVLLALAWRWWRRRIKPETAIPAAPVISPEREAYQALDALAAETGFSPKPFYFRLSEIVRQYTERRFDFPAAEMTTEELLPRVDRLPLNRELAMELKSFCRTADPVKFADAPVERQRMTHDLAFARSFVHQTTKIEPAENEEEHLAPPETLQQAENKTKPLEPKKEVSWRRAEQ